MDYEMKYKAVLKTATQWIKDGCTDKEKICLECVFPELAESEDLEEAANKFAHFYDQGTCDGIAQDCFKAGAEWQKEKMIKEAVEGEGEGEAEERQEGWHDVLHEKPAPGTKCRVLLKYDTYEAIWDGHDWIDISGWRLLGVMAWKNLKNRQNKEDKK